MYVDVAIYMYEMEPFTFFKLKVKYQKLKSVLLCISLLFFLGVVMLSMF